MLILSKYKDDLIKELILNFKQEHDGISPTLRHLSDLYGDIEGIYASTSVMRNSLRRVCKANGWNYTYRGVETQGEWHNDHENSLKNP